MRFFEFRDVERSLLESGRGIIGSVIDTQDQRGDTFIDDQGNVYQSTQYWKFPEDPARVRYEPKQAEEADSDALDGNAAGTTTITPQQQFEDELKQTLKMNENDITWCGGQKYSTGFCALVVELTSEKNRIYVGKYFQNKASGNHIFWQMTQFIRDLNARGINVKQKKAAGKAGVHGSIEMFPTTLKMDGRKMEINNIPVEARNNMSNFALPDGTIVDLDEAEKMVELLENIGGQATPINPEYKANYEVQLGEVAAPYALKNSIGVSGQHNDAAQNLLGVLEPGLNWNGLTQVEFPNDRAEKLIDSYMYSPRGTKIGVSSKDKKGGAPASIKSIIETIEQKKQIIIDKIPDFETRFKRQLDFLDIINRSGGKDMAFNLAAHLGLMTQEHANKAAEIVHKTPGDVDALRSIDGNGEFYSMCMNYEGYKPKNLSHPMYQPGWHMTAALARIVCAEMNTPEVDTYRFFAAVLESSNMVQVKTAFTASGETGKFSGFQVIYPPVFDGMIKFDPGSYYYANDKPGVLTFKFYPGKKPKS